jgi:hypothetical protein
MTRRKPTLYVHETTGDIVTATKSQAKYLPDEYKKVEFTKNDEGTPVMRLRLKNATVDVSDNGSREVVSDGDGSAE